MQVLRSAIHKMEVVSECGCKAVGEFSDAAYKVSVSEPSFVPCEKHSAPEVGEVIGGFLRETLRYTASDYVAPVALPVQDKPVREYREPTPVQIGANGEPVRPAPRTGAIRRVASEAEASPQANSPVRRVTPGGGVTRVSTVGSQQKAEAMKQLHQANGKVVTAARLRAMESLNVSESDIEMSEPESRKLGALGLLGEIEF